jgi:hypothetical protein
VLKKSTTNGEAETNGANEQDDDEAEVDSTQERHDPKSAWVTAVYEDDAGEYPHQSKEFSGFPG